MLNISKIASIVLSSEKRSVFAFISYFSIILHIEKMIKNIDNDELNEIKFNYQYSKDNFKIYDATKIPRLKEKNVDFLHSP